MPYVMELSYETYRERGRASGTHTAESPAVSRAAWDAMYPGGVWIPATDSMEGAVEKSELECDQLCERSEANMQALIAKQSS